MNVLVKKELTLRKIPVTCEEINIHNKKNTITRIKEEFRKIELLRVIVKGMNYDESKDIVHELRQSLYRPSGYIGLQCLSEVDWGQPAEYNETEQEYCDYICIPKDYDNPKEQIKEVIRAASIKIYEIRVRYNKRCRQKLINQNLKQ